jgi:hypothetical protein
VVAATKFGRLEPDEVNEVAAVADADFVTSSQPKRSTATR